MDPKSRDAAAARVQVQQHQQQQQAPALPSDWATWQLLDSLLPTGGFAHSNGLEAAMQAHLVRDAPGLRAFAVAALENAASLHLPFLSAAHRAVHAALAEGAEQDGDFVLSAAKHLPGGGKAAAAGAGRGGGGGGGALAAAAAGGGGAGAARGGEEAGSGEGKDWREEVVDLWVQLDAALQAMLTNHVAQRASTCQGTALLRVAAAVLPHASLLQHMRARARSNPPRQSSKVRRQVAPPALPDAAPLGTAAAAARRDRSAVAAAAVAAGGSGGGGGASGSNLVGVAGGGGDGGGGGGGAQLSAGSQRGEGLMSARAEPTAASGGEEKERKKSTHDARAAGAAAAGVHSHHAPILGVVLALAGCELPTAQRAYLFTTLRDVMSAATRLNLIGPLEAAALQFRLARVAEAVLATSAHRKLQDACQVAPVLDTVQGGHDFLFSRLFSS